MGYILALCLKAIIDHPVWSKVLSSKTYGLFDERQVHVFTHVATVMHSTLAHAGTFYPTPQCIIHYVCPFCLSRDPLQYYTFSRGGLIILKAL